MELDSCTLQKIAVIKERACHIQQDCKEWKHTGDWLRCGIIHYVDTAGEKPKKKTYETVERTTRTDLTGVDGVDVITLVSPTATPSAASGKKKKICLVAVYRPPVDSFSIEFPSGLVDPGETLQRAAKRELAEETGYSVAKIRFTSPTVHTDPWKSNENTVVCIAEVTTAEERAPLQLDEMECLEPIELDMRDLRKQLDLLQKDYGFIIDAKLYCFAVGLELTKDS